MATDWSQFTPVSEQPPTDQAINWGAFTPIEQPAPVGLMGPMAADAAAMRPLADNDDGYLSDVGHNLATFGRSALSGAMNLAAMAGDAFPSAIAQRIAQKVAPPDVSGVPPEERDAAALAFAPASDQVRALAAQVAPKIDPNDVGDRVESFLGGSIPMLAAGGLGGAEAAGAPLLGRLTAGARAMALPAAETARSTYVEGVDAGLTPLQAGARAAVAGAGTEAFGVLPPSLGGNIVARILGGGALQGGAGELARMAENAVTPDSHPELQQQFDPLNLSLTSLLGGGMAAALGAHADPLAQGRALADQIAKDAGMHEPVTPNKTALTPVELGLPVADQTSIDMTPNAAGFNAPDVAPNPPVAPTAKAEPSLAGRYVVPVDDVDAARAALKDAGLPQGFLRKNPDGTQSLAFSNSLRDKVAPILEAAPEVAPTVQAPEKPTPAANGMRDLDTVLAGLDPTEAAKLTQTVDAMRKAGHGEAVDSFLAQEAAKKNAPAQPDNVVPLNPAPVDAEAPSNNKTVTPTVEVPLANLSLSKDVPQFKGGANESTGVVEPLGGTFDRRGTGPIQVWRRNDGTMEVISGRHRLDLARRSGEETIPAQVYNESDGFTKEHAASLDAELNIRDGQGKVADYVQYLQQPAFQGEAGRAEADSRGLLARSTGRRAHTIASQGDAALIAAHRAGEIKDDAAVQIAQAAPNDARLQALGMKLVAEGKSNAVAANTMRAVKLMAGDKPSEQGDIFGFDDSAMREAENMARVASAKQRELSEQVAAVQGAAKRPDKAKALGVDVRDPEGVNKRIAELKAERAEWDNWSSNPRLVSDIRGELGLADLPVRESPPAEDAPFVDTATASMFSKRQGGADADMFGGSTPERAKTPPERVATQGGLFAEPTVAERLRAAVEAKDAARNAGTRTGTGEGGLFDGNRPDQVKFSKRTDDLEALDTSGIEVGEPTAEDIAQIAALQAKKNTPSAPKSTRISPSSKDRPIRARSDLLAAWTALARHDDAFQHPISGAKELPDIFRDVEPGYTAAKSVELAEGNTEPADVAWRITTPEGDKAAVFQKGKTVWIDVSDLDQGSNAGSRIYNAVANYAHNTGRVFIGDPAGLSDIAMKRRLENMVSSALKFGTTEHLAPHPRQSTGTSETPKLDWRHGDDEHNLTAMLKLSAENTTREFPEVSELTFNPKSRRFERPDGTEYTDADFKHLAGNKRLEYLNGILRARGKPTVEIGGFGKAVEALSATDRASLQRALTAGSSSLKRAVLTNGLSRGSRGEVGRTVLDGHGTIGAELATGLANPGPLAKALQRILYSKTDKTPANAGVSVSEAKANAEKAWGKRLIRKLTNNGVLNFVTAKEAADMKLGGAHSVDKFKDVQGLYDPATSKAYVIADNVNAKNIGGVILHEVGTHFGAAKIVGKDTMTNILSHLEAQRGKDAAVDKAFASVPEETPANHVSEEGMGYLMEQSPAHRLVQRFVDAYKRGLNRLGIPLPKAESKIEAIRRIARENLRTASKLKKGVVAFGKDGDVMYQRVFHGTPHRDIEKTGFSLHKIGTGEGHQAYGYGMYFAGNKDIAEHYRKALAGKDAVMRGAGRMDGKAWQELSLPEKKAITEYWNADKSAFSAYQRNLHGDPDVRNILRDVVDGKRQIELNEGQLYHAEIPEDSDLLDWDKPLSGQPAEVRAKLEAIGRELPDWAHEMLADRVNADWGDLTGNEMYQFIGRLASEDGLPQQASRVADGGSAQQMASKYLESHGIPGLRYLDGSSRNKGEGSHNYVIWDEAHLNNDVTPYYSKRGGDGGTFYSALHEAVTNGQGMPKKGGEALRQWLDGAQRRGEFKGGERQWLGVDQWLDDHPNATRQELADFVRANQVQVTPVKLEKRAPLPGLETEGENITGRRGETKFGAYTLPGGENYRELLLTLPPTKVDVPQWKVIRPDGHVDSTYISEESARIQAQRRGDGYTVRQETPKSVEGGFRSSHFDQPNILAHVRMNDRTTADGKKALHIEEIQSDWHQKGRKQGYLGTDEHEISTLPHGYKVEPQAPDGGQPRYAVFAPNGDRVSSRQYSEQSAINEALNALNDEQRRLRGLHGSPVPNAPLKNTEDWAMLGFKHALREAVDSGSLAFNEATKPHSIREQLDQHLGRELASVFPLKVMDAAMLPTLKNNEIRAAVVKAIPVDVVNVLAKHGITPERFAREPNMFGKALPVESRAAVARGFADALELVGTRLRTALDRVLSGKAASGNDELIPAVRARDLDAREVAGLLSPSRLYGGDQLGRENASARGVPAGARAESSVAGGDLTGVGREPGSAELARLLNRHDAMLSDRNVDDNGPHSPPYDKITWTTGETQADRYDLSKQVDQIVVKPRFGQGKRIELALADRGGGGHFVSLDVDKNGNVSDATEAALSGKPLADVVGKEMADKIMASERATFSGNDLKVGGEGMRGFYDKILPKAVEKYVKQWGGKVGTSEFEYEPTFREDTDTTPISEDGLVRSTVHSVDITPAMRESVEGGQPLFSKRTEEPEPAHELPPRAPGESQDEWHARVMRKARVPMIDGVRQAKVMRDIGRGEMRAMWARHQRQMDRSGAAFKDAFKVFDKAGKAANLEAIHQWETGKEVTSLPHRLFFHAMKDAYDKRIQRIRELAPGSMQDLIENYFPHLWEDPTKAAKWYQALQARGPLEGNKSFLKQRVHDTIKDGMESGLKPISTNPVDLVLAKMAQMDKFIAFNEFRKGLQERGWLKEMDAGERVPYGYARVEDPAFRKAGGLQGYYAVPELIAKDINNYLAPSLYRFAGFKAFRGIQNFVMQARLGWSLFHLGFTTFENFVTHANTGVQYALHGDPFRAVKSIFDAAISPVWSPIEGHHLNQQWLGLKGADANIAAVLDALAEGGAHFKMSRTEYNNALPKFLRALRQRDVRQSLKSSLGAIGEAGSWFVHHVLVPNQKMAARVNLAKFELDRVAGQFRKAGRTDIEAGDYANIIAAMHPDALKQIIGKVVSRIDDRLGQMNYDNQFWNKTARESLQALVGAVGWQVGTVRTVTGAAADVRHLWAPEKLLSSLDKEGKITGLNAGSQTDRLTYLATLALVMGATSAITQYAMTGQGPQELKDYFFPKTGRKNADGSDERLQYPSYWMDHYKLATHPIQTAEHKIHPSIGMIMEAINNQDYFGTQIRNPDAPWAKQAEQVAEYIGKGFLPYTWTNMSKASQNDASIGRKAASIIGVTNAPASVSRTDFQAFVAKGGARGWAHITRTPEQAEYKQRIRDAEDAIRLGKKPDLSGLAEKDIKNVTRSARSEVPILQFSRLSIEDKLRAYDLATDAERERYGLREIIKHSRPEKSVVFKRLPADEQQELLQRIHEITNSTR